MNLLLEVEFRSALEWSRGEPGQQCCGRTKIRVWLTAKVDRMQSVVRLIVLS